ncbi:hypothetical protein Moror_1163 [Moniliophthora roreri MCA 2997]|uniref:G-protein coupled receptors family 3 profile domain-containing protein n=1 Tax=Moniliophthora roreri (strain MCA 2997) TaxID=1381753 RepID=V2WW25_MONRO|nr:hypothetical protein Moror_1163 [Moniliophthora roreri MCA 2997]
MRTFLLLLLPYILWAGILIGCFAVGASKSELVLIRPEDDPYCFIDYPPIPLIVCSITAFLAIVILVALVSLLLQLKKSRASKSLYRDSSSERILLTRLIIFSFLGLIATVIAIVYIFSSSTGKGSPGVAYDLSFATLPPSGVLIFGTQKDILIAGKGLLNKLFKIITARKEDVKSTDNGHELLVIRKPSGSQRNSVESYRV